MSYNPLNPNGRASAANSQPQVLSTEDKAVLDGILSKIIVSPATEGKQDAIITALSNMLAEMKDDVFVTAIYWEDRSSTTQVFYREERIRSQDDGSITTVYTRLSDNTVVGSLPAGSILVQGANDRNIEAFRYKTIASGTGYTSGDWLTNTLIYDTDGNGSVISSSWYNLSTGLSIAAPAGANIQAENEAVLAIIAANIGATNETAAASDTATSGLNGLFKRLLQRITALLPASLTGLGNLKVSIEESSVSMGGGTQYAEGNTTSPATGNAALGRYQTVDPVLTNNQLAVPQLNLKGEQRVFNKPWKTSGTLTVVGGANQTLELDVEGMSVLTVQTSTAWTGSALTLQGSVNGSTWVTVAGTNINAFMNVNGGGQSQTISANTLGIFRCNVSGFSKVRIINLAVIASGVVTLTMLATNAVSNNVNIEGANSASQALQINLQGVGGGFLMKTEDSAHASGDVGIAIWGVRQDVLQIPTSATNDYGFLSLSSYGSLLVKEEERHKATYSCSFVIAPDTNPTDLFIMTAGSKTLALKKMTLQGSRTTAGPTSFTLIKRSTGNTGGTMVSENIVPHDASDPAASGRVYNYSLNPAGLGTPVAGYVKIFDIYMDVAGNRNDEKEFTFGNNYKSIELRGGTTDCLALSGNSTTVPGGRYLCTLTFTEV